MINDPDRFKHDRTPYERPNAKFRCGRGARWQRPCHQGPNPDGSCAGAVECAPAQSQRGAWECRRPPSAGGPCPGGPTPDGVCSQQHPPCQPRLTIREYRARLVLAAFALMVALIGALHLTRGGHPALNLIDPGPLSAHHAGATAVLGCAACHNPPAVGSSGWLRAVVTNSAPSTQCLTCHAFGGPPMSAHNTVDGVTPPRGGVGLHMRDTTCVTCHTEHHGAAFNMTQMTDAQCNTCHAAKFASFTDGHPEFPERFPYEERTAIAFDHQAHLNRYFKDPKFAAQAPQSCTSCHAVQSKAERSVPPGRTDQEGRRPIGRFEQTCARCHAADLSSRDLVLFRFPALSTGPLDPTLVRELCGTTLAVGTASEEEPTPISGFLLGVETKDPDVYSKPIQDLMLAMAKDGVAPLASALDQRAGSPVSADRAGHPATGGVGDGSVEGRSPSTGLLAGLNPEVVKQAACAWIANQEYRSLEGAALGGWHADALELRYTPTTHADPVARRWIEFAAQAPPQAEMMRRDVLSRTRGVGSCLKCHADAAQAAVSAGQAYRQAGTQVAWSSRGPHSRPFTTFSHGVHLDVLGGALACASCHVVNPHADEATVGSFQPITKAMCAQCHGASPAGEPRRLIRQDCLLCHAYHRQPEAPALHRNTVAAWSE